VTPLALLLVALVADDGVVLRSAPTDAAPAQATLYRGDWLEVRGEVVGFFRVWDHRRERPGYVRPAQVRIHRAEPAAAPELAAIVRFLRAAEGFESLGVGYAALYLRVASPAARGPGEWGEVLAALGTMADRLGKRSSGARQTGNAPAAVLAGQVAVVEAYGVRYRRFERVAGNGRSGHTVVCYDGEAFAQVVVLAGAAPSERAAAALALTRRGCLDPATSVADRRAWNDARLTVLGEVDPARAEFLDLPRALAHRLRLRRAEALTERAHTLATGGDGGGAGTAASAAMKLLALVDRGELAAEEVGVYDATALRVGAVRALTLPVVAPDKAPVELVPAKAGASCIRIVRRTGDKTGRFEHCSFGVFLPASLRVAPRGDLITIAVAPLPAWTELLILRARDDGGWQVEVIPPVLGQPGEDIGYVESAGFSPDGRGVLIAREFELRGRLGRRFEVVGPTGVTDSSSRLYRRFSQWASPLWRRTTLALR
jgi:hypothetical protein